MTDFELQGITEAAKKDLNIFTQDGQNYQRIKKDVSHLMAICKNAREFVESHPRNEGIMDKVVEIDEDMYEFVEAQIEDYGAIPGINISYNDYNDLFLACVLKELDKFVINKGVIDQSVSVPLALADRFRGKL